MLLEDSTRWALRHPLTSGLLFAAVGIAMIADARADGEILERFLDAPSVEATVETTYNAVDRPWFPDFKAVVTWLDPGPEDERAFLVRRATIDIFRRQYERLEPGDAVPVLVSREEPVAAVLESRFRNAGVLHVLGLAFSNMVVVGAIMMAFGLSLWSYGVWGMGRAS